MQAANTGRSKQQRQQFGLKKYILTQENRLLGAVTELRGPRWFTLSRDYPTKGCDEEQRGSWEISPMKPSHLNHILITIIWSPDQAAKEGEPRRAWRHILNEPSEPSN